MKKVLIISYYWPPSGGAGVQRWLKFVKYLPQHGWQPIVYTPENPEAPAEDSSLQKDVPVEAIILKTKIWEPYTAYKRFIGQKKEQKVNAGFLSESEKPKFTENLSVWIRGNFFIPDARKFWIKPSVKYLKKYIRNNPVDVIISTGPPHSMHMIALGLSKAFDIPWIADFRDPWTNIDFYDQLKLSKMADRKHKRMEQKVLKNADKVVTVSWSWAKDFESLFPRSIDVLTNGFDPDDFRMANSMLDEKFSIVHIGAMNKDRNSEMFWEVIKKMIAEIEGFKEDIRIKLIGKNDISVTQSIRRNDLVEVVERISYLPHEEVLQYTTSARLLYLPLNNTPNVQGIIPGKVFEYLASNRPILCIGTTTGDTARILRDSNGGIVVDFNDKASLEIELRRFYENFKTKSAEPTNSKEQYSRKKICGDYVQYMNSLIQS